MTHHSHEPAAWTTTMREAYDRARFDDAAAIFDGQAPEAQTFPAALLRCRLQLHSDPGGAVDRLLALRVHASRQSERFTIAALLGSGFARLRDFSSADKHFESAVAFVTPRDIQPPAALADRRARRYLLESRIGDAWRCFELTLVDRSNDGRLRSERLKSAIHHAEERYAEQAESIVRSLNLLAANPATHLAAWFYDASALAMLARELPDRSIAERAGVEMTRRDDWSPNFEGERFAALRSLAWCKALDGDHLGALRFLREASALAETFADNRLHRTTIMIDRAYFASANGETRWASDELAAAEDLARLVDWNALNAQACETLFLFAELFAGHDQEKAALYLARGRELASKDVRFEPLARLTSGLVHTGASATAKRDLKAAWDVFERLGFEWRAGRAALALARNGAGTRWHLLAAEKLELYPQSWLQRSVIANAPEDVEIDHAMLTPMQQRVFTMICNGLSTDAIAGRLGRSQHTVRNHIKLIFKAYDVRSRPALIAKANRTQVASHDDAERRF